MAASLPAYDLIPLPGEGPEDVVVGSDGLIYTGLLDGRILAVAPKDGAVREVAKTGGRPLGLEATTDGRLLICDSPKVCWSWTSRPARSQHSSLMMARSR